MGPAGPVGPPGPPGLIFLNAYKAGTAYVAPDVVTYQGSSYVALIANVGVRPVGDAASEATWAILAQAGANGANGANGVNGAAGVQGVPGTPGVAGAPGMTGAVGPQGPVGAMGPQGPSGPTGPSGAMGIQGATGAAGANLVSFLSGRKFGVQGDSISAIYGNAWQNVVAARTGMILISQDARSGRRFDQAFECYGTTTPGSTLGVYQPSNAPGNCLDGPEINGHTLAQNLANVDLEIVSLGTNDRFVPIGSLGDSTSAGTLYGNIRWVVETYLTAKPSLRLILVTAQYNILATPAVTQQTVNATVAYGNSVGIPVINMFALGGVNAITAGVLTRDGVHPSDYGFANNYGPVIAQALQQFY